jgi:pyruvate,orthophosphate dikinase
MATSKRRVYFFGNGKADGLGDQKELLGGKGAGLAEMTRIGLPVPAGFTITTDSCAEFHKHGGKWPTGLLQEINKNLTKLERVCKKKLGGTRDPLLVSVRSGAAKSMPGMMETILNLGLNDESVEGLAKVSGNRRFALDAYRRLIMMYGSIVRGIDRKHFETIFDEVKHTRTRRRLERGNEDKIEDTDISAEEMEYVVEEYKRIYQGHCKEEFPQKPLDQLRGAISAVFDSWMAEKAETYRRVERITGLNGTAVNICQMVFGNMGEDSGTGVCFTRDPSTGDTAFYGDWLINAQGEDVVAGTRTPLRLAELKTFMPEVYEQLEAVRAILEVHYKDMQDLEFTVERGKLFMLQCRAGKRSPGAAFKIAVDQATKGLMTMAAAKRLAKKKYLPNRYATAATKPVITRDEAILRIDSSYIERLFYPVLDSTITPSELKKRLLGTGIGAVPGAACGEIAFSAEQAELRAEEGAEVILVRKETSPEDVGGMHVSSGILTATGGKTSHAAVVARGWGKCCIVGCDALSVDYDAKTLTLNGRILKERDTLTLDGGTGNIYADRFALVRPEAPKEYNTLMQWVDKRRRLLVRTNVDTPMDAQKAIELGAEGIGLCRTEHMFFDPTEPQRMNAMREMILADDVSDRRRALDKLLPFQRRDFEGIFTAMKGKPVTIRLFDPPLHEFLPQHNNPEGQQAVVDELNASIRQRVLSDPDADYDSRKSLENRRVTIEDIRRRVDQLHESNPMLGHRGCRLAITYPEILEMQVRAIMEAAVNCTKYRIKVLPEIMIPLSIDSKELAILVERTHAVAKDVFNEKKAKIKYLVGTMIETPRAALTASQLAATAEFFSFGTNDLTQMTMGLSRDDAGRFLSDYVDHDKAAIFADDPFNSIDEDGVGQLLRMAIEGGRSTRPKIKLGICGEHGGEPKSVTFCHQIGLDYVSCSPYRVPVARLAAAQAVISAPKLGPQVLKANDKPKSLVRPRQSNSPIARTAAPKTIGRKKRTKKANRART